jgi:hypothetical protein
MSAPTQSTEYRVVYTASPVAGPHSLNYVHDAARPWAVLRDVGHREICVGRYPTIKAACALIRSRTA